MTRPDVDAATIASLREENARLRAELAALSGGALIPTGRATPVVPRRPRAVAVGLAFVGGVLAVLLGVRLLPEDLTRGFLDGIRGVPPAEALAPPAPPAPPGPPSPP